MVATQYQWKMPDLNGGGHGARDPPPHRDDAVYVFKTRVSDLTRLQDRNFDIAFIFKNITELIEFLMKMRIPDRTGTHIHAAPIGAKINRHTDNIYLHTLLLNVCFEKIVEQLNDS